MNKLTKLEVGKSYRRRDGKVVTIDKIEKHLAAASMDQFDLWWANGVNLGRRYCGTDSPEDLIEEVVREVAEDRVSMRTEHQQRVAEFMLRAGQNFPDRPEVPPGAVRLLRARLIFEEALETIAALGISVHLRSATHYGLAFEDFSLQDRHIGDAINLEDIADGCADISVVTTGTLLACGIADRPLLEEVDRSNLAKFTGDGHRHPETGKWIKPSDWAPPNIAGVLGAQKEGE